MDFKNIIAELIYVDGVPRDEIYANISIVQDSKMGDFCLPCFKYAKATKKSPAVLAAEIAEDVTDQKDSRIANVQAVNGYVNFTFSRKFYTEHALKELHSRGAEFKSKPSNGKTICIDYSSINIAKPFHIGHLLTTVIGGSLYRIYGYLGYNTVGINHLGDWGTQFGKMITAYLKWGEGKKESEIDVRFAAKLYARFHEEAERDESLNEQGRMWFKKLEDGDPNALRLFRMFKEITLREVKRVYQKLGIKFDSYKGESFFNNKMTGVITALKRKKLLVESEGAKIVDLSEFNMPPALILKSDGTTLYATRDLATAYYRHKTYNFDKCLYVVAYQQSLYFKQLFKVLELMGAEFADRCIHVPFGMVSIEGEGSLSTRKGNVVYLKDVLTTSVEKAHSIIEVKNPNLADKRKISEQVGIGAVIFGALATSRIKDLAFSFERALNFDGETAPYIQYTHARCCSILEKKSAPQTGIDFDILSDGVSFEVVKYLSRYDDVVLDAAEKYEPGLIARYLIDLAQVYNKFYLEHRVITENETTTSARLYLTECVKNTLSNGLKLILISAPQKM